MFNDASQFVQGISATVLGLGATDEIDLNSHGHRHKWYMDVSGTLTTAAVTASGTATFNGAVVINGATAIGDLNILADGTITTDTNGDFVVDPAGTGAIVLTGPITATGVQTTTGQLNVDNLRLDGNTLSATSGAITLTPAAGQNVIVGGTNTNLTGTEANFTLMEATTVRANFLQNDTSDGDLAILHRVRVWLQLLHNLH